MNFVTMVCAVFAASMLGACGEKPQVLDVAAKKPDDPAWKGAANAFVAQGWTPGDAQGWRNQLRQRNQNQNDYSRAD